MSKRLSRACASCRRKKIRCDGVYPKCKACNKSGIECIYATPPLQSYVPRKDAPEVIKLLINGSNSTTAIGHVPVYESQEMSEYKQAARTKFEARSRTHLQRLHELLSVRKDGKLLRELIQNAVDLVYPCYMLPHFPSLTDGLINGPSQLYNDALFKVSCYLGFRFLRPETLETNLKYLKDFREDIQTQLAMSITQEATLATANAFLLQSIHDMVYGKTSLAWTYSGIAFRMVVDLGVHHPAENLKRLAYYPEEYEMRQRLWWSSYLWDKLISLYMGRMPTFPSVHPDMPLEFCKFF
ncbi:Tea1p [Sugiyamaella lignohabitans]|uniref:Tea1p n=1 Tax=Sugiyamaella lignohabitans TaxID=796027 RepID=A0A167FFU8_9ASCO|nr:Tea1p [Sugiyamaella lignohabitans]ANB15246.1 Tea1p [Sugiyamaella lignohabitans]